MEIGNVLSRAWRIIWKHKILWIFGILASCSSGNWGSSQFQYRMRDEDIPPRLQPFFDFNQPPDWQITLLALIIIAVVFVLVLLAIFFGTVGRIGLIRGASLADQRETGLSFGELFNGSLPYFWRVFGINLLFGVAAFVIAVLVILVLAFTVVGLICLIPFLCIFIPLVWLGGLVVQLASNGIVIDNLGIMAGIERGWNILKTNLGPVLLMAILLVVISVVAGFILGIPFVVVVLPAMIGLATGSDPVASGGLLLAGLCLIGFLPVAILLNGILQSFVQSAWTLTYLRLTGRTEAVLL